MERTLSTGRNDCTCLGGQKPVFSDHKAMEVDRDQDPRKKQQSEDRLHAFLEWETFLKNRIFHACSTVSRRTFGEY